MKPDTLSQKPVILLIETATEACSVALSRGTEIIAEKVITEPKRHAALLAPFIKEVTEKTGLSISDCSAVAVSEGPGSYTGLRVGVSTAKGLCFGAGIPLLSVGTLQILAMQGIGKAETIIPMIDARRMEVYSAVFNGEGKPQSEATPVILDENSFSEYLDNGSVLFIGNGVEKFKSIINNRNASFISCYPLSSYMAIPAFESMQKKEFKDVAYFEPFYLKEFVAGISKKRLL